MTFKQFLKTASIFFALLVTVTFIYLALPQVYNPNPEYQTELGQGEALPKPIADTLTPDDEPARARSIMVLINGKVAYQYGPTDKIMNTHSMRKSMLSLLYGIAIEKGLIDINKTLKELNINEYIPLTEQEKTATVRDLLTFRSGIYIPADGEHDDQITKRPKRDSHKPGEYFFSNNFDANALGTILIQETGYEIGDFMEEFLAKPLGLQDFSADNVIMGNPWFWPKSQSHHRIYYMHISTRDMARIGYLVANNGQWQGKQIVPQEWIQQSISRHSDLTDNHINYGRLDGFGYTWWLNKETDTVWTDGYGEHFMLIDPANKAVFVERNFTGNSHLSSGLWLYSKNMESGYFNLLKAHKMYQAYKQSL